MGDRSQPLAGRVAQDVGLAIAVDDDTRRGRRQPVPPLSREDFGAAVKRLRQPNATGIVMAKGAERHDGQASFLGLEANICSVKMKTQIRIEPQAGVTSHDQKKFVECRDLRRQLGAVGDQPAAIDNPADTFGAQRPSRVFGLHHLADTVNPGDADRTKPPLGLLELLHEASVPTSR